MTEEPMTPIFLIVGSPGVGKSTIGRALAAKFDRSLHIPVDTIRYMVVSGIELPDFQWSQELIEQLVVARESVCAMAFRYNRNGFVVTVDDFWDHNSQLTEYQGLMAASQTHKILLYPREETALARNFGRYGPGEKNDRFAGAIRFVYSQLYPAVTELKEQGWLIVDSTEQSIEETVAEILERKGSN